MEIIMRGNRHFCFLTNTLLPSISTSYLGTARTAGGLVGSPVLISNLEPCQGHSTSYPSSVPSSNGPPT